MQFETPKIFTVSHLVAFALGFALALIIFISLMFIGV
jgi:hypothetical protein